MIIDLAEKFDSGVLADYCSGKTNANIEIKSISIDSREVSENTLFVALRGENNDGHKYIDVAVKNGAVCVMCEKLPDGYNGNYILVKDSLRAISDIASARKEKINPFTVGVTGSVGKTTTKEFISYVLSEKYPTHKSGGNFNTVYGLSLTLCALSCEHKALVAEMGMSSFGEISVLTRIARPDVAVITNIGTSHLENLGSRENICKAKLEIAEGLKETGTLVYNGDEPLLWEKRDYFKNSVSFGINNTDVDVYGKNIRVTQNSTVCDMIYKGRVIKDILLPAVGVHQVYNAMAAYITGKLAGMCEKEIRNGLLNYKPSGMRQRIYKKNNYTVIEDCYNASPESMKASLSVLSQLGENRRTIAVLGEMKELGAHSPDLHKSVGQRLAELNIDRLYTYGKMANSIADGAVEAGMDRGNIVCCEDTENPDILADLLKREIKENDIVLFKASRAIALERVIGLLD